MIKYYLTSNGKQVNVGDTITISRNTETVYGHGKMTIEVTVTEKNLPLFIKNGHITAKEDLTIEYFIKKIAEKLDIDLEDLYAIIDILMPKYKQAILSMLLKEISNHFNQGRSFRDYEHLYIISASDGEVHIMLTKFIKTYKYLAPFVVKEHALKAKEILKDLFDVMYGKQKNT